MHWYENVFVYDNKLKIHLLTLSEAVAIELSLLNHEN